MLTPLALLLVAAIADQPPADRSRAEQLARDGRTSEAMALFEQIVAADPSDVEARLWIARLDLRLGRTDQAEAGFRAVVDEHPADVDARIGLGAALTRKGEWPAALELLRAAERDAGENADLYAALARAYRRAGDDRSALDYFTRAKALAPTDPDVVAGFESTAHAYGHAIAFDGFVEGYSTGEDAAAGALTATLRVTPRLHLDGRARVQQRSGSSDAVAGIGARWQAGRATTLEVGGVLGSGNVSLPNGDLAVGLVHYAGTLEIGANVRGLSFAGAEVVAASPTLAWDGERWRLDTRYTYSRSAFDQSGQTAGDHSAMLRETWRAWRRAWLQASYAYGIESFEQLTADRLGAIGAHTVAAGMRIGTPSLTIVTTTWEHQWRSNDSTIDRLTLSIVQTFR
jgi:tetratricopeptide (TPR) repeat protein